MDPFDDFLPEFPVARARQGGKFMPKSKSKQLPRKEIYASDHATSCDDRNEEHFVLSSISTETVGFLQVESRKAIASDKEFVKSNHSPVKVPNLDYDMNPELDNFPEGNCDGATTLDALPSTILSCKVNGDWDSNFLEPANEGDPEGHCVCSVTKTLCMVNASDGMGSKSASNYKVAMSVGNTISNSSITRAVEVDPLEFVLDPFVDTLPEAGPRNASKFQPKTKPRPRLGTTAAGASASPDAPMEKSVKLPASCINKVQSFQSCGISSDGLTKPSDNYTCSSIPLSDDSRSLEETIPSQSSPSAIPSEIAIQNNARDWPSSFGKSSGETTDIFSGLECLDDFLTQAGAGTDQTFGTPLHEGQTNAADSSTFGDMLHVDDVPGENIDASEIEKDATMPSSPRSHKGGEPLRQFRKRANRKPVDEAEDGDVDSDDDLDPSYNCNIGDLKENDVAGVDCSSKKRRASTSSKKKSGVKSGKQSQKRKKANEDSEKSTKEPPKKFSHSTRQRKRLVDKALLETPEDELDPRTLQIRDIILLAEYRERLAKKEAATGKTSSNDQRCGGDSLRETDAHDQEILASEDERGSDDDRASGRVPVAPSLFNYQSFMDKAPNGKWSKQDTELFYEAVRQFGTDFSMIQQLFPGRTRHQVKLKYKKEERQHPLRLSEAVNNRAKDHCHFKSVIERLQQASSKAEEDDIGDGSVGITSVEDLMLETDEVARSEQETVVKDQDDVALHSPEKSDDSDNDVDIWSQYRSDY